MWESDYLISDEAVVMKGDFTLSMNIESVPETVLPPRKELHIKIKKCRDFSSFSWKCLALLCHCKQQSIARL